MVLSMLRRLLGIETLEEELDEVRAEQRRIARELDQIKRSDIVGLDVDIERQRGWSGPPAGQP